MILEDKILRACSVCKLVELEEYVLLSNQDERIIKLTNNGHYLSHTILSRKCAESFYGEDFFEITDVYIPGLDESGKRIYEICE